MELVAAPVAVQDSLDHEAERHPALAKVAKLVGMVIQCRPAGLRLTKRDGTDATYRPVCTVVCSSDFFSLYTLCGALLMPIRAEVSEYEQADRRGQITVSALLVDLCNQLRQCHSLNVCDFLQVTPEGIFKANAGLVSINDDGTFDD